MRFSLALIAAVAAATSVAAPDVASIVSQIPSCTLTCVATASAGQNCAITDYACQCGKMSAIQTSATPCVTTKCQAADAIKVLSLTGELCKVVGSGSGSSSAAGAVTTRAAGGAATPTTLVAAPSAAGEGSFGGSSFPPTSAATSAAATSAAVTSAAATTTGAAAGTGAELDRRSQRARSPRPLRRLRVVRLAGWAAAMPRRLLWLLRLCCCKERSVSVGLLGEKVSGWVILSARSGCAFRSASSARLR
ncbi:hypothetical protein VE04_10061 [Pseudogymnoascus sp. 24MN13]|nr:hypothetical protein VE04_10061 [Pseudogymnoascus sp. 24MN13]